MTQADIIAITRDPQIRGGRPVITGTGFEVAQLLCEIADDGASCAAVEENFSLPAGSARRVLLALLSELEVLHPKARSTTHYPECWRDHRACALEYIEALRASVRAERDARQRVVVEWGAAAFGLDQITSVEQRGLRLIEKAIEAAQAAGCDSAMLHKMVDYVFARPSGDLYQELGGVSVCLLAMANAAGFSADDAEKLEIARILAKPVATFTERNKAKNDAGFKSRALHEERAQQKEGEG